MAKLILFMQLLLLQVSLTAQTQWYQNKDGNNQFPNGTIQLTSQLVVCPNPVPEELIVTGIKKDEYDRVTVYNMQGGQLLQQTINGTSARIDATTLPEGVYLMVLHSTVTLKEKNLKFIVRR